MCGSCERTFETISALSSHKRRCDGGRWRALGCVGVGGEGRVGVAHRSGVHRAVIVELTVGSLSP